MRLDLYLAQTGKARSRARAKELIDCGCVTVDGRVVTKPSYDLDGSEHDVTVFDELPYVSRGGLKLESWCNTPGDLASLKKISAI